MTGKTIIECKHCARSIARELHRQSAWHKAGYCTQQCAFDAGWRDESCVYVTCTSCGEKKIIREKNARPWHHAGYCSAACGVDDGHPEWRYGISKKRNKVHKGRCAQCGKPLPLSKKFCDEVCRDLHQDAARVKEYQRRLKETGVHCAYCGKLFAPLRKGQNFCSSACGQFARMEKYKEKKEAVCDMCGRKLEEKKRRNGGFRCEICCVFYGQPSKPFVHRGIMDEAIEDSALLLNDPKAFDEKFGIKEGKNEVQMERCRTQNR